MAPQSAWRQQPQRPRQHQSRGGRHGHATLSNLSSFFIHSAPVVPVQVSEDAPSSSCFTLGDLWSAYDEWSAYGAEIPMRVSLDGALQEITQCYVPYLSGLQLFEADHSARRIRAPSSGYSSDEEPASSSGSAYTGSDSGSSVCTSSTASTASVDSDCEGDGKDSPGGACGGAFGLGGRAGDRGSVLRKAQGAGEPGRLLFEFFEEESPYARAPLADRVAELAEGFPSLLSLSSSDLHPASWFAVAWYPICRIPSLADAALSRDLQASLLTFHSLAVPPALPAELQAQSAAAHPIPPALTAPAAAALAWRSETVRQQLLASALSALAEQPGSCSSSGEGAGPAAACSQPDTPVSVAALRPFAFMPYKVSGRTWVDDYNLRTQHLPMISAAGMWLERRKARLPDFDFFSRNFRPLPTGHRC